MLHGAERFSALLVPIVRKAPWEPRSFTELIGHVAVSQT